MKQPNFMVGPPGTGKTSKFITQKYTELLLKFSHEKIIVLSHTKVAAEEIRDEILKLPEVKEKGLTKKSLKYKICTIHAYCQSKGLKRDLFSYQDHINLCMMESRFKLQRINASDFEGDKHKFYKYLKDAFGKDNTLKKHWKECDKLSYKPYSLNVIEELQGIYQKYKKDNHVCDYDDMIRDFIDKSNEPNIDVLIVDEAQDSNVPQTKALDKMATNTKEYWFVGDPDQTIFEFAGANATRFYELSKGAKELEEGYRCSQTINNLCKKIIKPIWDYYGTHRIWKPTDVVGNHYHLPSLKNRCSSMDLLLDKIKNTEETFLFTYRGTPSDGWVKTFLKQHGIEYAHIGNTAHVPKKEIRCHKLWPEFASGKPMPLKQIKDFWTYIGTKVIVRNFCEYDFPDWINKDYTIHELINLKLLREDSVDNRDFALIRTKTDSDRILYIQKILQRGFNLEGDVKVRYGNIHTVKGLTFDNVIVDLTATRIEDYFTQLRLKYVAYSRGKFDCWTISSQRAYTLGAR